MRLLLVDNRRQETGSLPRRKGTSTIRSTCSLGCIDPWQWKKQPSCRRCLKVRPSRRIDERLSRGRRASAVGVRHVVSEGKKRGIRI